MTRVDPPWELSRLCRELATPSLFADQRLFVLPHAESYFALPPKDLEQLAAVFRNPPDGVLWLGLFAQLPDPPGSPLAEVLAPVAELEHLPTPPPPKPWEGVRLSADQRSLLQQLLAEEVPEVLDHQDVVAALLETHGFSPRQLVQAARSLAAAEDLSPETARRTGGREAVAAGDLERAVETGDWPKLATVLVQLAAGAALESFRGEQATGRRAADLAAGVLCRACLTALAVRLVAEKAGLARELDPAKVSQPSWYPREFKPRMYPKLMAVLQTMPELGLHERSPWSLQASFRLAARFEAPKLARTVANLVRLGALRGEGLDPWAPVVLAYASFLASSRSS